MATVSTQRFRTPSQLSLSIEEHTQPYEGRMQSRSGSLSRFTDSSLGSEDHYEMGRGSFLVKLDRMRTQAKRSSDPERQLRFVKALMDAAQKIETDPEDFGIGRSEGGHASPGPERPFEERCKELKQVFEAEAIRWLKRLATNGGGIGRSPLADAQFMMAECYGKGILSVAVDHGKAFSLYIQASKQNHPTATFRAAVCYELGAGTKRDNGRAIQFYRKSAVLGDHLAMHKLALILLYGKLGQKKNLKEGITWLKRAANSSEEGVPEALHDLAQCYEKKGGCPVLIPDEHFAFELYARAARAGLAAAQYRLGSCYEYGLLGCGVDPASSIKWYTRAAEQEFPDAELALSSWYLSGSHGILQQSDSEAYRWARKAADRGHARAEYQVGNCFEIGIGVQADPAEAARWYAKSAAHGHKRAAHRLADLKKTAKISQSKWKCVVS